MKKKPYYERNNSKIYWWCRVHNRGATHLLFRKGMDPEPVCNPTLPGITIPCSCSPCLETTEGMEWNSSLGVWLSNNWKTSWLTGPPVSDLLTLV